MPGSTRSLWTSRHAGNLVCDGNRVARIVPSGCLGGCDGRRSVDPSVLQRTDDPHRQRRRRGRYGADVDGGSNGGILHGRHRYSRRQRHRRNRRANRRWHGIQLCCKHDHVEPADVRRWRARPRRVRDRIRRSGPRRVPTRLRDVLREPLSRGVGAVRRWERRRHRFVRRLPQRVLRRSPRLQRKGTVRRRQS